MNYRMSTEEGIAYFIIIVVIILWIAESAGLRLINVETLGTMTVVAVILALIMPREGQ